MVEDIVLTPEQEAAVTLAEIGWRNVDFDRWRAHRMRVWSQFTDRLRLAATTTSTLSRFWTTFCAAMGSENPSDQGQRQALGNVLSGGNDRAVLRVLRQDTDLVTLMVRLRSEDRRASRQAQMEVPS